MVYSIGDGSRTGRDNSIIEEGASLSALSVWSAVCLLSDVCGLLPALCLLPYVCCLLSITFCLLSAACCLLPTVCCLLSACCLMSAACWLGAVGGCAAPMTGWLLPAVHRNDLLLTHRLLKGRLECCNKIEIKPQLAGHGSLVYFRL